MPRYRVAVLVYATTVQQADVFINAPTAVGARNLVRDAGLENDFDWGKVISDTSEDMEINDEYEIEEHDE